MFYYEKNLKFLNNTIIKEFNLPYVDKIDDSPDNIIIIPETLSDLINLYPRSKKIVYWLTLYYFFKTPSHRFPLNIKPLRKIFSCSSYYGHTKTIFHKISQKINYWNKSISPVWNNDVIHISNSYFAADFIENVMLKKTYILHNPVRDEFYNNLSENSRDKIILFGQKTKKRVVRYVQKKFPDFICIRLKRKDIIEVINLYKKSILFIEMGNFPGRDRMPREAVLSGCVVLISLTGSAAYNNDFNLPDYYKINTNKKYLPLLVKKIKHITSDYLYHYHNMQQFLDDLRIEKDSFNDKVKDIFDKIISDSTKNNDFSV